MRECAREERPHYAVEEEVEEEHCLRLVLAAGSIVFCGVKQSGGVAQEVRKTWDSIRGGVDRTQRTLYSMSLLSGGICSVEAMRFAHDEVREVVVLRVISMSSSRLACILSFLQLCEYAIEGCARAAGDCEGEPWTF